jgi:hypothetical protein
MWPFSEMSLTAATLVGTIANWVLLTSLLAGVLSTFVIVKTSDVKEEHWAEDRKQSAERIAGLNNETERLKVDNLRLQAQLAPRSLTKEQFDEIQSLKGKISAVNLAVEDDVECSMFSGLLAGALQHAGIAVLLYNLPHGFRGNVGLMLYDQHAFENLGGEPTNGEPLVGVLKRANLFSGRNNL